MHWNNYIFKYLVEYRGLLARLKFVFQVFMFLKDMVRASATQASRCQTFYNLFYISSIISLFWVEKFTVYTSIPTTILVYLVNRVALPLNLFQSIQHCKISMLTSTLFAQWLWTKSIWNCLLGITFTNLR